MMNSVRYGLDVPGYYQRVTVDLRRRVNRETGRTSPIRTYSPRFADPVPLAFRVRVILKCVPNIERASECYR